MNMRETSFRMDQVTINLDLNPGRRRTYNSISVEKGTHEAKMSREEEKKQ